MGEKSLISVIMGVYNCAETLPDAVGSIIRQTYDNWELIICDDGSTDSTFSTAGHFADLMPSRVRLMRNECNLGLNVTLNRCLMNAKGEYIARMDGDDLCDPMRFEKQIQFLENNPEYDIVSSGMLLFDEKGVWGQSIPMEFPQSKNIVEGSPICHAPSMMRRRSIMSVNGYSEENVARRVEDVDLWIRMYHAGYRCYNIQEPLYSMRNDRNAFQRRKYRYRVNSTRIRLRGCRYFKLGFGSYLKAFRPMIVGIFPAGLRKAIKKRTESQYSRGNIH